MELHRFFLELVDGHTAPHRAMLPKEVDSVALAQEQAEREARLRGHPVRFYSETLLGEVRP